MVEGHLRWVLEEMCFNQKRILKCNLHQRRKYIRESEKQSLRRFKFDGSGKPVVAQFIMFLE